MALTGSHGNPKADHAPTPTPLHTMYPDADATPIEPGGLPTAGQLWHQLLTATVERRAAALARILCDGDTAHRCVIEDHHGATGRAKAAYNALTDLQARLLTATAEHLPCHTPDSHTPTCGHPATAAAECITCAPGPRCHPTPYPCPTVAAALGDHTTQEQS